MRKLYSVLLVTLLALSVFACTTKKEEVTETVVSAGPNKIMPLYTELDMNNLADGDYNAAFEKDNVVEKGDEVFISTSIYSEDLYDTVEIHQMKAGDTIFGSGQEEKVEKVIWDDTKSRCCINFDNFDDAVETYEPSESGGTYYVSGPDGHHSYTMRGKANLKLSKNCVLKDSSDLEKPEVVVPYADIVKYIKEAELGNYMCLNTKVSVTNGEITEIIRWYIP